MAGVNGIEIKVGQVWRCRDGQERRVVNNDGHKDWPWDLENGDSVTDNGAEFEDGERSSDLIELVKDENGALFVSSTPQPADSATLAEETLVALGWTFDGQAWVENAVVDLPIGMVDSPVSAPALLTAAAKHMNDRAATYDKPEGERSMAQTVAVFEAFHGIKLTEAQGWHFMQVLKDVRLFTRETYHGDSAEDCIAYAALKAEAKAQEPANG
jgi:hypothetical protein